MGCERYNDCKGRLRLKHAFLYFLGVGGAMGFVFYSLSG